jgi:hydroxyacylglutathione hydrolase
LFDAVNNIVQGKNKKPIPLVIAHTHSHGDHHAADAQFSTRPNTTIVGLQIEDIKKYFGMTQWPEGMVTIDLGGRVLDVVAIPGHHISSIAFYDRSSKLLLAGDTFYPGRLYVDDWVAFKKSVGRLYDFALHHEIEYIVGAHIEMSMSAEVDYPTGSTYHPEEQRLPLTVEELGELNASLKTTTDQPERMVFKKFIVSPK